MPFFDHLISQSNIRLRRSSVPGETPPAGALRPGEIAVNSADGVVFIGRNDGTATPPAPTALPTHVHSASDITSGTVNISRLPVVLEKAFSGGNAGTETILSLADGSVQKWTLNSNCVFYLPFEPPAGASLTLFLTQGNGAFTAGFDSAFWPGGSAPVMTAVQNKRDIFVFVSDGSDWFGTALQNF